MFLSVQRLPGLCATAACVCLVAVQPSHADQRGPVAEGRSAETRAGNFGDPFQSLYDTKQYDQLEQEAVAALGAGGISLDEVQRLQTLRMKAFLAGGEKAEALQAAKVLYNVARFKTTTVAVKEIAECLRQAHPDGERAARAFRLQQQWASRKPRGGTAAGEADAVPLPAPTNPLAAITVDGSAFRESYEEARGDSSPAGLARQASLLLLMDRPAEAEKLLRQAWQESWGEAKATAAEDLARAIRAADGGTGRALAFLESLVPSPTSRPR